MTKGTKMIEKAKELYKLTTTIKALTEKADALKNELREEIPTDGLDLGKVVCKVTKNISPVINNQKLYRRLTTKEIEQCTKPVISELKKLYPVETEYNELMDAVAETWNEIKCIKFFQK